MIQVATYWTSNTAVLSQEHVSVLFSVINYQDYDQHKRYAQEKSKTGIVETSQSSGRQLRDQDFYLFSALLVYRYRIEAKIFKFECVIVESKKNEIYSLNVFKASIL